MGWLFCGIVGIVCFFICLGIVLGPAAAIMGFISRQRIVSSGGTLGGGGLAIAGLTLGIVAFFGSVAWLLFFILSSNHTTPTQRTRVDRRSPVGLLGRSPVRMHGTRPRARG